ncbi:hypothetical protein MSG28_015698 [Choristoneura fumiferana]|uniref:Uncharacterized protein n=1 Tax=Choristoneura fumiferana TaxID=7141 RepID=A0ACC0KBN3_CHOFU|nr:hypothetical protein MSG28_015698 [Choristoneura fumiferana]
MQIITFTHRGKYCMIHVPFTQPDFELPTLPEWPEEWPEWPEEWPEFPWPELLPNTKQHKELMRNIQKVQTQTKRYNQIIGTDMDLMRYTQRKPVLLESHSPSTRTPAAF